MLYDFTFKLKKISSRVSILLRSFLLCSSLSLSLSLSPPPPPSLSHHASENRLMLSHARNALPSSQHAINSVVCLQLHYNVTQSTDRQQVSCTYDFYRPRSSLTPQFMRLGDTKLKPFWRLGFLIVWCR